jgi:hypothetical protein
MRSQLVALGIVIAVASCTVTAVTFSTGDASLAEDCSAPGDEDGNGLADCADPVCADTPACKVVCGNSNLEAGEQCDNGGADTQTCNGNNNGNGGLGICRIPACGDDYINEAAGEQCDTLGGIDSSACNGTNAGASGCHLSVCGDGYINGMAGESCDDIGLDTTFCNGKTADAASCHIARCGDGYVNARAIEACDNPGGADTPTCNGSNGAIGTRCNSAHCGDGYTNRAAGEQCDTFDGQGSRTCNGARIFPTSARCQLTRCGDGYINTFAGEQCETDSDCSSPSSCRNCQCI